MRQTKLSLILIAPLLFLNFHFCKSIDTITPTHSIKDGEFIVSNGEIFELGFFSPGNSKFRYVGIWYYKVPEKTVIWVANRDNPINDTSGVLAFDERGTLVIYKKNQTLPVWSANVSSSTSRTNSMAQLLDTGNFILSQNGVVLWQSFEHPTDTWVPDMKLGLNRRTGKEWFISSWKSIDDPATGNIFLKIDPTGYPQLILYKGSDPLFRAGPWTGVRWSGVPEMAVLATSFIFNVRFVNNNEEVSIVDHIIRTNGSVLTRMIVNESGTTLRTTWNNRDQRWFIFVNRPKEQCDTYETCGPNSNCDPYDPNSFACKCLPGFEPRSPNDWYLRDGSGGCRRKAGVSTCKSGEGFVKVVRVALPDTRTARANMSMNLEECKQECLKNCSCSAYTNADERGFGCLNWYGDLVDMRTYLTMGQDIYVRVDAIELGISFHSV